MNNLFSRILLLILFLLLLSFTVKQTAVAQGGFIKLKPDTNSPLVGESLPVELCVEVPSAAKLVKLQVSLKGGAVSLREIVLPTAAALDEDALQVLAAHTKLPDLTTPLRDGVFTRHQILIPLPVQEPETDWYSACPATLLLEVNRETKYVGQAWMSVSGRAESGDLMFELQPATLKLPIGLSAIR